MDEGEIEVDSIRAISLADITPDLARRSGFKDVVDLLAIAKHGRGDNIYLIRFHYLPELLASSADRPYSTTISTSLSLPLAYGALHTKFAASLELPTPVYCATCGYGQSGRVISTLLLVTCEAVSRSGATPDSRHRSSAPT